MSDGGSGGGSGLRFLAGALSGLALSAAALVALSLSAPLEAPEAAAPAPVVEPGPEPEPLAAAPKAEPPAEPEPVVTGFIEAEVAPGAADAEAPALDEAGTAAVVESPVVAPDPVEPAETAAPAEAPATPAALSPDAALAPEADEPSPGAAPELAAPAEALPPAADEAEIAAVAPLPAEETAPAPEPVPAEPVEAPALQPAWRVDAAAFDAPADAPLVGLVVTGLEGPEGMAALAGAPVAVAVDPAGPNAAALAEAVAAAGGEVVDGLLAETRAPEARPELVVPEGASAELAFQTLREAARRAEAEGEAVVRLAASRATLAALARWRAVEGRVRLAPLSAVVARRGGSRY